MLDLIIRGATIVDGTGAPGRAGDVGVPDGRIVAVAHGDGDAGAGVGSPTRPARCSTPPASSCAPASSTPTPTTTPSCSGTRWPRPSNVHGVTSIVAGNCGFTLAPLHAERRRLPAPDDGQGRGHAAGRPRAGRRLAVGELRRVPRPPRRPHRRQRRVHGRPLRPAPLRHGRRRHRQRGHARPARRDGRACCTTSIEAGGLGFSTTLSSTHSDGDGQPVASRHAGRDELLALCAAVGEHEGTFLEGAFEGGLDTFSDDEIELVAAMSAAARPVDQLERAHRRLGGARPGAPPARRGRPGRRARAAGSWRSPCRCSCP